MPFFQAHQDNAMVCVSSCNMAGTQRAGFLLNSFHLNFSHPRCDYDIVLLSVLVFYFTTAMDRDLA